MNNIKFLNFKHIRNAQKRLSSSPYLYLTFAFIVPVAIMYLVYVAIGIHPFGEESVLVLDLNGQYVYFFEALRNFVRGDASLLYSFSRSLGGEFMGIYAYYLASPLSYLVALFPTHRMLEAILFLILLKVGLCGLSFGFYLHKNSKRQNKLIIIAFSIMYSLCAYAITYQENTMWIDALIWLPIIAYSVELLIKFGKFKLFIVSLTIALISNYYIGYMICIFVALYFFYYYFSLNNGSNNLIGEKRHFLRSFVRIGISAITSLAISACVLLPAYYSLTFGKTGFSNPSWAFKENFELLDFFTKFLPGAYDSVSFGGLPLVYGGILMIILVPVYFAAPKIKSREKILSLALIMFFVFSFIASPMDLIWHGFQHPNWLNYRYSFMLVFILLTLAYRGIGNLSSVGSKFIIGIGAFIVMFAALCQKETFESYIKSDKKLLSLETVWLTIIATILFVALLCLLIKAKDKIKKESICFVLVALVCIEIFCSTLTCFVKHDEEVVYSNYDLYNNFLSDLRPVVQEINENDSSFFRFEKTNHKKSNDNMALGIRGLSNSTSTLNAEIISLLRKLGYASDSHWSKYLGGTPVSDSFFGIKYIINKGRSSNLEHYYSVAHEDEVYTTYLNPYALSIAFGVDSDNTLDELDLTKFDSSLDATNALVSALTGNENTEIFIPLETLSIEPENCNRNTGYKGGYVKYENFSSSNNGSITFTFTALSDEETFMYIPTTYTRECGLSVNGKSLGSVFAKESKRIVSLGKFEIGETVTVKLTITNTNDNVFFIPTDHYFYHIDTDAFIETFTSLKNNPQFIVNEGFTDDNLEGTITTDEKDQMILTTIPYDEGWNIYLDGERIEIYKSIDSLIAFNIAAPGEHSLTMTYRSSAVTRGTIITFVGIALFIILSVAEFLFYSKKEKQEYLEDPLWLLEDFVLETDEEDKVKKTSLLSSFKERFKKL